MGGFSGRPGNNYNSNRDTNKSLKVNLNTNNKAMTNTEPTLNNEEIIDADFESSGPNVIESDVIEITSDIQDKTKGLVVLSDQLKIDFPGEGEQKYLFELKGKFGGSVEKLDSLYDSIIGNKIERVMKMLEDSGYDTDKIEYILGSETVEKMNAIQDKVDAVKKGTLTIEEQKDTPSKGGDNAKWFGAEVISTISNFSKGLFNGAKDQFEDFQMSRERLKDNVIILNSIRPDIEEIIEGVLKSKDQIIENYEEYYKNYMAICFMIEELEVLKAEKLDEHKKGGNTITLRNIERAVKKIENRIDRFETSKNLINFYVMREQDISDSLELIVDNIELEYKESSDVVASTLTSLLAQQPVETGINMGNDFQDLKIAAMKQYVASSNNLNDNMTKLDMSAKHTKQALIDGMSATTKNIKDNNVKKDKLKGEIKQLDINMRTEGAKLRAILKQSNSDSLGGGDENIVIGQKSTTSGDEITGAR